MENVHKPYGPYEQWFKRPIDFTLALIALIVLSPLLLILTVVGAIAMRGNPFFLQERPGRIDRKTGQERIFTLIKFRTMSNAKDANGNMLPEEQRMNKYGKLLRSTSCDELPSLVNILYGHLAIVGPRPLLVKYLPYYSEKEHHRHDVRPGLTGYAQVNGRNATSWDERFAHDLEYVNKITFVGDILIVIKTVGCVLQRKGIHSETTASIEEFKGSKSDNRVIERV